MTERSDELVGFSNIYNSHGGALVGQVL